MSGMNKYHKWLNAALEQVSKDFAIGKFQPENESDVQCHLYHCLLRAKESREGLAHAYILSEFPVRRGKVDLAIVKKVKDRKEPRLLLEIKETHLEHREPEQIEKKIRRDVKKLLRYKDACDLVIYFFFREARRHGIGTETNRKLEGLESKYNDEYGGHVSLKWGPV